MSFFPLALGHQGGQRAEWNMDVVIAVPGICARLSLLDPHAGCDLP